MGKMIGCLACLIAMSMSGGIAYADGASNLDATYSITTKDLIDPLPTDKRDRVMIFIKGESAKQIFNAMLTPARRVDCDGKPMESFPPTKTAGGLECSGDDKEGYTCSVAVKLDTGATLRGYVCDPQ